MQQQIWTWKVLCQICFLIAATITNKIIINSKIEKKTDKHIHSMCDIQQQEKKIAITIHNMYGSPNNVERT